MLHCPSCSSTIPDRRASCVCGADLLALQEIETLVDAWFNRAVEALEAGDEGRALEWLAACSIARPSDVEALAALALLWIRLGRPDDARRALERARSVEPDAAAIGEVEAALSACASATLTAARGKGVNKSVTKKRSSRKRRPG